MFVFRRSLFQESKTGGGGRILESSEALVSRIQGTEVRDN